MKQQDSEDLPRNQLNNLSSYQLSLNEINIEEQNNDGLHIFYNKIILKSGISLGNYIASLAHYLMMPFIFVSVESLQPMYFQQQFNLPPEDQGTQNANIILADIITKAIFAPIVGSLNDKFGRRYVLFAGILIISISTCIFPLTQNIYYQYLPCRIFYAIGSISVATIPLLADYVQNSTKGKASALNVVMASVGAIISSQIISYLKNEDNKIIDIRYQYWIIVAFYVIFGVIYTYFVKPGTYFKDEDRERHEKRSFTQMIKIGARASKNPWILQGYITNFLGRGDSILLTMSLVMWSYTINKAKGYEKAELQAEMLSGVAYTAVLVFAIFYGIFFEKINKYVILLIMYFLTAVGCFMMWFADSTDSIYTFITMGIMGSGMSGLYTAAQFLINKYAETNHRGYITGLANIFSVIGIFLCAVVGGYLFDSWNIAAPFALFSIMSSVGIISIILSYFFFDKKKKISSTLLQDQVEQ